MCSSNIADHFNVLKFIKIQNQQRLSIKHVVLMLMVVPVVHLDVAQVVGSLRVTEGGMFF